MKNFFKTLFGKFCIYTFSLHIFLLLLFFCYRIIFIVTNVYNLRSRTSNLSYSLWLTLKAGAIFDNSIIVSINTIPFLVISFLSLLGIFKKKIFVIFNIYILIIYSFVFGWCCSDIPYFNYFFRHIDLSILNWKDDGTDALLMVFQNKSYIIFFVIYILSVVLLGVFLSFIRKRIFRKNYIEASKYNLITSILILFGIIIFAFYSIFPEYNNILHKRRALNISDSYGVTENVYLNHSIVSGFFNFYKSYKKVLPSSPIYKIVDNEVMNKMIEKELHFDISKGEYFIPNKIENIQDSTKRSNIVIILVESFSNDYLKRKIRNNEYLMPFMNSLKNKSIYFSNFYSQAVHTNQGIVATLYSYPSIFERHMLRNTNIYDQVALVNEYDPISKTTHQRAPSYKGLPQELASLGYETTYMMTHDPKFDNEGYTLNKNGFKNIISSDNYPQSKIRDVWGVSDAYLFNMAIHQMDSIHNNLKRSFFTTIQTISNHTPYTLDKDFKKISDNDDENAMAYEDKQLELFFHLASEKEWFNNTIFVILGDHGKAMYQNQDNEVSLSLNHIPLYIYSPLLTNYRQVDDLGGQVDIYPTIMGLIGRTPTYKSFGKDILNNKREYIFYTTDEKLVCISDQYIYSFDTTSKNEYLAKKNDLTINIANQEEDILKKMNTYSGSMIDGAKYILNKYLIDEDITK